MPGVSTADGFALIYFGYLSLWLDADICKKTRWDENIYVFPWHKVRKARIHEFDLINMVFQTVSLASHRNDIDKYACI